MWAVKVQIARGVLWHAPGVIEKYLDCLGLYFSYFHGGER